MLTRILSVGLLAGLLAGLLIAAVQQVTTTPLILAAEAYEKPAEVTAAPKPHKPADSGVVVGNDARRCGLQE